MSSISKRRTMAQRAARHFYETTRRKGYVVVVVCKTTGRDVEAAICQADSEADAKHMSGVVGKEWTSVPHDKREWMSTFTFNLV